MGLGGGGGGGIFRVEFWKSADNFSLTAILLSLREYAQFTHLYSVSEYVTL